MIKFFRKIRQKLLAESKFSAYLIYAIGEIFLVVIGILIALQINNWNESRKASIKETKTLNILKSEMVTSLMELKQDQESNVRFYEAALNVYHYIREEPALVDSMYIEFYKSVQFNYSYPNKAVYETLKSGDLGIVKSDALRMLITNIYESGYESVIRKITTRRNAARLLFPYYKKHFITKKIAEDNDWAVYDFYGIPNDYAFITNDPEYEALIVEAIRGRKIVMDDFTRTIKDVEHCIAEIDKYLKAKQYL